MLSDGKAPLLHWSKKPEVVEKENTSSAAVLEPCVRTKIGKQNKKRLFATSARDSMDQVFANFHDSRMKINQKNQSAARAKKSLTVASVFCLLFMIAQAIGGYAAGSLAIMTDAAHLFSDFISLMISLFSLCLTKRSPSTKMTFGWHRAEVLGALASLLMIWGITSMLVYVAVGRLRTLHFDIKAELMLITASVGVCFNIIMAVVLHKAGDIGGVHGHSHGCSSSSKESRDEESLARDSDPILHVASKEGGANQKARHRLSVRAALLHVASDFLQSSAVLVAAIVIYCKPHLAIIDPMCTFLFSILVLTTTIPILKEIVTVLMEGAPRNFDLLELVQSLRKLEGVERVTNLRVWSLNTDRIACTVHITVDVMMHNWRTVLETASDLLTDRFRIDDHTIQIVPLCDARLTNARDDDCTTIVDAFEQ